MYNNKAVEQHERGFQKAIRQARFFTKDLDLGLFDLFKDVKDGVLLDEEDIAAEEEAGEEAQDVGANVQAIVYLFIFFFPSLLDFGHIGLAMMKIIIFSSMQMIFLC